MALLHKVRVKFTAMQESMISTTEGFPLIQYLAAEDFDKDGNVDILIGGNFYQSQQQVGIYDASYGVLLKGDGKGDFAALPAEQSGINIREAVRDIKVIRVGKKKVVVVAENNGQLTMLNQ